MKIYKEQVLQADPEERVGFISETMELV